MKDLLSDPSDADVYFQNFEGGLKDENCFRTFALWEKELQGLVKRANFARAD
jgi:hypothetical protein